MGTLIFDGDCGFCRSWIERWKGVTGPSVDYRTFQEVGAQYPEIEPHAFTEAVHFIDAPAGGPRRIVRGAEAVFASLATSETWLPKQWLKIYRRFPAFRWMTEKVYAFVARNRRTFSWLTYVFIGEDLSVPRYRIVRTMLLRGLGAIGVIMFGSLLWQAKSNLYPAATTGLLSSLYLLCSPAASRFLPWMGLVFAGSYFMGFQWDPLMIETAVLCALFTFGRGYFAALLGLRLLLFRFYFETQSLPTPLAWIALVLPWLILGPRRIRLTAFFSIMALQIGILLTGNYAHFHWLTLFLSLTLLDDQAIAGLARLLRGLAPF